jgi:DNA-binding response OmpR family regulator
VLLDTRSALVLEKLAEEFGECVSKDTLLATAWPGRLVHENSLAKAISRLRKAISGSGLAITAAYGLGYTLGEAGEGSSIADDAERPQQFRGSGEQFQRPSSRWMVLAPLAILATTALAVFGNNRSEPEVSIRSTAPLTHDAADALATVLWVDDNPSNNRLEVEYFKRRKIAVHLVESTEDALKLLQMNHYQLVLSDLGRGDDRLAGLKLIQAMKQQSIMAPVIIYTIRPDDRASQQAQQRMVAEAGALDLAVTPSEVRSKVIRLIAKPRQSAPKG